MIPIQFIIFMLLAHLIGDFFLQSQYMSENKSKDVGVLFVHVLFYTITIFAVTFLYIIISKEYQMIFMLPTYYILNGVLHFIIDFITSKITSRLYKQNKIYWFFVTIGCDQTLHFICLFGTYILLFLN